LLISSLSVYDSVSSISSDTPTSPSSLYGKLKSSLEYALFNQVIDSKISLQIIRFPHVYNFSNPSGVDLTLLRICKIFKIFPLPDFSVSKHFISIAHLSASLVQILQARSSSSLHVIADPSPISLSNYISSLVSAQSFSTSFKGFCFLPTPILSALTSFPVLSVVLFKRLYFTQSISSFHCSIQSPAFLNSFHHD
jgi:hypothetical protein